VYCAAIGCRRTILKVDGEQGEQQEKQQHERDSGAGGRAKAGPVAVGVQDVDLPAHIGRSVGVVVHHVRPGQVRGHLIQELISRETVH
jgi:hypothetical protein